MGSARKFSESCRWNLRWRRRSYWELVWRGVLAKRVPFSLVVSEAGRQELDALRAFEQVEIADAIETKLVVDPLAETRKMKKLGDVKAGFAYERPLCELKVGNYRVYYNVDVQAHTVYVQGVRHKPPQMTTEEALG